MRVLLTIIISVLVESRDMTITTDDQSLQVETGFKILIDEEQSLPESCKLEMCLPQELRCPANIDSEKIEIFIVSSYNCDENLKKISLEMNNCQKRGTLVFKNFYTGKYLKYHKIKMTFYDYSYNLLQTQHIEFAFLESIIEIKGTYDNKNIYSQMTATFEFTPTLKYYQNTNIHLFIPMAHQNPTYSRFQPGQLTVTGISGIKSNPPFLIYEDKIVIQGFDESYQNQDYTKVKFSVAGIFTSYFIETVSDIKINVMYDDYKMEKSQSIFYNTLSKINKLEQLIDQYDPGLYQISNLLFIIKIPFFIHEQNTHLEIFLPSQSKLVNPSITAIDVPEDTLLSITGTTILLSFQQYSVQPILKFQLNGFQNLKYVQSYNFYSDLYQTIDQIDQPLISTSAKLQSQINQIETFLVTPQQLSIFTLTQYTFQITHSFTIPEYSQLIIDIPSQLQSQKLQSYELIQGFIPQDTMIQIINNQIQIKSGLQTTSQTIQFTIFYFTNPNYVSQIHPFTASIFSTKFLQATKQSNRISFTAKIFPITSISSSFSKVAQKSVQLILLVQSQYIIHQSDHLLIQFLDSDILLNDQILCFINKFKVPCSINQDNIQINYTYVDLQPGEVEIILKHFTNPSTTKEFQNFITITHKSQDSKLYQISDTNTPSFQLTSPQDLIHFSIKTLNNQFNQLSNYQITVQTPIDLSPQTNIEITFPISLNGASGIHHKYFNDFLIYQSGLQVKVKTLIQKEQNVTLEISNILNPTNYIQGFDISITLPQEQFPIIEDRNQELIQFEPIPLKFFEVEFSSLFFQSRSYLDVKFETNLDILEGGFIKLIIPKTLRDDHLINLDNKMPKGMNGFQIEDLLIPQSNFEEMKFQLEIYNRHENLIEQGVFSLGKPFICSDDCEKCEHKQCLQCKEGFFLRDSQCILECPERMIKRDGICFSCQTLFSCLECSETDLSYCMKCQEGYAQMDGFCIQKQIMVETEDEQEEEVKILEEEQKEEEKDELQSEQKDELQEEQYQEEQGQNLLVQGEDKKQKKVRTFDGKGLVLIYILIVQTILLIIKKITRQKCQISMVFIMFEGILDVILMLTNFILFLVNDELSYFYFGLCYSIGNFLQMIYSEQLLINLLKVDMNYNEVIQGRKLGKLINFGLLFYDWKIIYITMSNWSDNKLFNIEYQQQGELFKKLMFLMKIKLGLFQPTIIILSAYYLITSISYKSSRQYFDQSLKTNQKMALPNKQQLPQQEKQDQKQQQETPTQVNQ